MKGGNLVKTIHISTSSPYDVIIERDIINKCGELISSITKTKKAVIITDDIVSNLYLDIVKNSLQSYGFDIGVFIFPNC